MEHSQRAEDIIFQLRASNIYGISDVLYGLASVCNENYELHFLGQGALLTQLIDPSTERLVSLLKKM